MDDIDKIIIYLFRRYLPLKERFGNSGNTLDNTLNMTSYHDLFLFPGVFGGIAYI